jgi:hypothetical protein
MNCVNLKTTASIGEKPLQQHDRHRLFSETGEYNAVKIHRRNGRPQSFNN